MRALPLGKWERITFYAACRRIAFQRQMHPRTEPDATFAKWSALCRNVLCSFEALYENVTSIFDVILGCFSCETAKPGISLRATTREVDVMLHVVVLRASVCAHVIGLVGGEICDQRHRGGRQNRDQEILLSHCVSRPLSCPAAIAICLHGRMEHMFIGQKYGGGSG